MFADYYTPMADMLGISVGTAIALFVVIATWSLIWKGFALWKSARKNHLAWFVILLVVNTIGILEILYLFVFSEMKFDKRKKEGRQVKRL